MIVAEIRASKDWILFHKLLLQNDLDLFIRRLITFSIKRLIKLQFIILMVIVQKVPTDATIVSDVISCLELTVI